MLISLAYGQLRSIQRAGACPLLEIMLSYPILRTEGEEDAALPSSVARFNETYRSIAENLMNWAKGEPCEAALADFEAAGPSALYRFDRRMVVGDMNVTGPVNISVLQEGMAPAFLTVTRRLRVCSRRGEIQERALTETDVWRWPELTLCGKQNRGKS